MMRLLPNAGTSFIYKMIRKKNITVNRKKTDGKARLEEGDSVEIFFSDETFLKMSAKEETISDEYEQAYNKLEHIEIVYEDDDFIFVDKPANTLSQKADIKDVSMNEWLIGYLLAENKISRDELDTFKPAFCNRLDRNTTGFLIGGKTLKGLRILSKLLRDREMQKFYLATVRGLPDENLPVNTSDFLDLRAYLIKDKKTNKVTVYDFDDAPKDISDKADYIHTGCRLVKTYKDSMLVEVDLYTGKSHQIRAHLAHTGHPIIGDIKYGNVGDGNFMLRAYRIVFPLLDEFPQISGREFVISDNRMVD